MQREIWGAHLTLTQQQRDTTEVQYLTLDFLSLIGSMRKHCGGTNYT